MSFKKHFLEKYVLDVLTLSGVCKWLFIYVMSWTLSTAFGMVVVLLFNYFGVKTYYIASFNATTDKV